MSVQAGTWNFTDSAIDQDFLERVRTLNAAYGPDGDSAHVDCGIALLHLPFHTTKESRVEHQPYRSTRGALVTWDGRLDNREDLIRTLAGDLLADDTDVAIVASAFDKWGTECFAKIRGDWAAAIWCPHIRRLILVRDYIGVRHLFYCPAARKISWCTHLEPLALSSQGLTICDEYFAGYLALWPDAHLTPYREIKSVPPGSFVVVTDNNISIQSYWALNPNREIRYKRDAEYEDHFRDVFRRAVRTRLRTDSSVLADLSGGLDSSSIVCTADQICSHDTTMPRVDTFSFIVLDEPGEEDSSYISSVEARRGRAGYKVQVSKLGELSPFDYSAFVAAPGSVGRPEQNHAKADVIRTGNYRVLLSGTGGDEMLGQALDPRIQLADLLRQLRFGELVNRLGKWSLLLRRPWIHLFMDACALQLPASLRCRRTELGKVPAWVNSDFAQRQNLALRQLNADGSSWTWTPSAQDWFHTVATLARQMTKTRPSIAETRYPYLDQELVEFLTAIPTEQLLRPGDRRSLMRRALKDVLPSEVVSRTTKSTGGHYFSAAIAKHWNALEPILQAPVLADFRYVNKHQFYLSLVAAKNGNLERFFSRLAKALSWELWLRDVISRGVISAGGKREYAAIARSSPLTWNQESGVA